MPSTPLVNNVIGAPTQKNSIIIGYPKLHVAPFTAPVGVTPLINEGWRDLGMVDPGTVELDFGSEIHDVTSGSPATVKQRFVVARKGSMKVGLAEYTPLAVRLANGTTIDSIPTLASDGQTTASADATQLNQVTLTSVSNLAAGDTLQIDQGSATYGIWTIFRRIQSIAGSVVTLDGNTDMLVKSAANCNKVSQILQVAGGNQLQDWQARLVFSATNGDMVVYHFPLVNVTDALKPTLGDGKTPTTLPVMFEAIGQSQAVSGFSAPQVVIANIYTILPVSA